MPGLIDGVEPIRQTGCVIIPSVLFSRFYPAFTIRAERGQGNRRRKKKKKGK